ncbi:FAD-dependent oxidoreductase [Nocardioides mangrovicus]|uniref:FAD-dependent oxidoreductase n=1 Tax=Nocardioides mangrovicus TaxID=2478913 RepID=UPI001E39299A|nr:FAD-dependent oxidoreductase [Nocardioides mangrovicus]
MAERVLVVGAGVVGLSCAVRLLESGHQVDVLARDLPRETTSAVAAALWYPYLVEPRERVSAWSAASFETFAALAKDEATGVRMLRGRELVAPGAPAPWWGDAVPDLEVGEGEWRFTSPVADMPVYVDWLAARVGKLGGTITRMNLAALPELPGGLVVDCSGIGARLLARDLSVTPVRGQVVLLEQWGLDTWHLDDTDPDHPVYVIPRRHEVVVGGTAVEGEWSRTPAPAVAQEILRRAAVLVPEIAGTRVVRHKVGLRPARPQVRVERQGDVVHCYGHGGAGMTVSWGCADEVSALCAR